MAIAPAPYALISPEGDLSIGGLAVDMRELVGPQGPVQARLVEGLAGWVNDDGYAAGLTRNVVGALVLAGFHAALWPYPGPVVITGWHPYSEVVPLNRRQVAALTIAHADARRAAGLDDSPPIAPATVMADARELAELLRTMPTPGMTVRRRLPW